MKLSKCIISGFLAIAMAVSLTVPAFAVDPGVVIGAMEVAPDFGSWLWSVYKGAYAGISNLFDDDVCEGSFDEPGVSTRHSFVPMHTQVDGKTGMFDIPTMQNQKPLKILDFSALYAWLSLHFPLFFPFTVLTRP